VLFHFRGQSCARAILDAIEALREIADFTIDSTDCGLAIEDLDFIRHDVTDGVPKLASLLDACVCGPRTPQPIDAIAPELVVQLWSERRAWERPVARDVAEELIVEPDGFDSVNAIDGIYGIEG
jgi:hypothetical protein